MLCISYGAEMRFARTEQDATMKAAGYEHQKFECVSCLRTERRLAFSGESALCLLNHALVHRLVSRSKSATGKTGCWDRQRWGFGE